MKFSLFRLPSVRKFDYKPLYFNPEKEARAQRRRIVLGENYIEEPSEYSTRIKGSMRKKHQTFSEVAKIEKKKSNIRLVIIAVILSIIAYYLFASSGEWMDLMWRR